MCPSTIRTQFVLLSFLVTVVVVDQALQTVKESNITESDEKQTTRHTKFLNLFSVIRFSNTPCQSTVGTTGTCYTEKECGERSGISSGACAGGFGVCCTFSMSCGQTSSENCTYLSSDVTANSCVYTVCRCNPEVTMLRLDFTEFNIAQPFTCGGSGEDVVCSTSDGPLIGDCMYDSMTVTNPGGAVPPVICGYNSGQHMYVESSEMCNKISFNLAQGMTFSRKWEIKVTQYDQTQDGRYLAPPGCLQYHTGSLGTIQNFNFKDVGSTHLSSQRYSICWRRELGKCSVCYSIGYFGMSNVPSKVPPSSSGSTDWNKLAGFSDSICCSTDSPASNCGSSGATDFLEIEGATEAPASNQFKVGWGNRFCGRWFGIAPPSTDVTSYAYSAVNAGKTICTNQIPFRMRVEFSDGEVINSDSSSLCGTSSSTAKYGDTNDECASFRWYGKRKGTLGFQLQYWQVDCS